MSERITASGTVHWIGTGLSTGSGLAAVCERAGRVVVWGRTVEKAEACLDRLGLSGRAQPRALDSAALAAELGPGDIAVSMLPATEHAALLRQCIAAGAHFACSSYVSEELEAESEAAVQAGIVVLTEAGLDPGLDHALAHLLVAKARAAVGEGAAAAEFTSFCGGVPAVANDFRYRFSWAPLGVLNALRSRARYLEDGAEVATERPWEATRPYTVAGETFEAYPNRDSLPFLAQYGFPADWSPQTFLRGTLRLDGWRAAWAPVFEELRAGDGDRISALARELAAKYPTTDADRDRVVLAVALGVRTADGRQWSGQYLLDLVGDEAESAMARCVSLPLAYGISEILDGTTPPGLHRAAEDAEEAQRWLEFLAKHGIDCTYSG
jgi:Saccharopine dehydrogenase C-terminal domain/Saccharopine dehydrogenase NADP binding domain